MQAEASFYPPPAQPLTQDPLSAWVVGIDLSAKVFRAVCTPLKAISWVYGYLTGNTPLREPPGSQGHGILGSYPELRNRDCRLLRFLYDYTAEYGAESGICRVYLGTKPFYIVTDPKLMQEILRKPGSFVRGDSLRVWRDKFSPGGLSEGKDTQAYRKQAVRAIGLSELPHYFPGMAAIADQWMERLESYRGEPFDLVNEAERAALATVGETLFKNDSNPEWTNPFGLSGEHDPRCERFLKAFHSLFEMLTGRITSAVANFPLIGEFTYSTLYRSEDRKFIEVKNTLKEILEPIFQEILEGEVDPSSHFYKLLKNFGIDPAAPNYPEILDKSLGFLQASFETSSKALGWVLYHLARDQELQERLRKELFSAFADQGPESLKDFNKVTLLSQIMEEALRLFPPFPILIRDIKNPEDFKKWKVEKGGAFLIPPYLINRNPKVWEDPHRFNPDRFQKAECTKEDMLEDAWQIRNPKYATFLGGIHRCPGRHFGKQELLLLIAKFIMRFRITTEQMEPVGLKFCITLQPEDPIHVRITKIA